MARPLRQRLQDQELGHGKADAPALPGAEMARRVQRQLAAHQRGLRHLSGLAAVLAALIAPQQRPDALDQQALRERLGDVVVGAHAQAQDLVDLVVLRSEEHTSELQSLMRISYAVFCLKKKTKY